MWEQTLTDRRTRTVDNSPAIFQDWAKNQLNSRHNNGWELLEVQHNLSYLVSVRLMYKSNTTKRIFRLTQLETSYCLITVSDLAVNLDTACSTLSGAGTPG